MTLPTSGLLGCELGRDAIAVGRHDPDDLDVAIGVAVRNEFGGRHLDIWNADEIERHGREPTG